MGTRIRALERQHGVMGAVGASPYVHFWCLIVLTAHERLFQYSGYYFCAIDTGPRNGRYICKSEWVLNFELCLTS